MPLLLPLILGLIAGALCGTVIGWFAYAARNGAARVRAGLLEEQLREATARAAALARETESNAELISQARQDCAVAVAERRSTELMLQEKSNSLEQAAQEIRTQRERAERLNADLQAAQTSIRERQEAFEREKLALKDAEQHLKNSFEAIAATALRGNTDEFLKLAESKLQNQQRAAHEDLAFRKQEVEQLLKPISETLFHFRDQVQQLEVKREGAYSEIKTQIDALRSTGEDLKSDTARLVNALKMPQQGGRWGEIQLRRVVELAGMVRYCDFDEQVAVRDDEDRLQRPDLTVCLPGGRTIVIDAKVSLAAYLEANSCDDEAQRAAKLKEHAGQVKSHLQRLSAKSYWNQFARSPEFVVAFLPGEALFSAALQQDPTLIEFGAEQRIVLATPTTLIALLKAVSYGWRQEQIAENAERISALGKILYERLAGMYDHIGKLRRSLEASVEHFNKMAGTLETRVMVTARKFRELGAAGGDEITEIAPIEKAARELTFVPVPVSLHALAASSAETSEQ